MWPQGTKQERNLVKPLYDRYQMVKHLLCAIPTITTIVSVIYTHTYCSYISTETRPYTYIEIYLYIDIHLLYYCAKYKDLLYYKNVNYLN